MTRRAPWLVLALAFAFAAGEASATSTVTTGRGVTWGAALLALGSVVAAACVLRRADTPS